MPVAARTCNRDGTAVSLYTIAELSVRLREIRLDDPNLSDGIVIEEAAEAIERLNTLLRQWQFDVGGASERLERETLAAINAHSTSGDGNG